VGRGAVRYDETLSIERTAPTTRPDPRAALRHPRPPGQLAELLERLIDDAPTGEERTNIRRAAEIVRTTAAAALSAVARGALVGPARVHGIL
jgi:hypothetical protein